MLAAIVQEDFTVFAVKFFQDSGVAIYFSIAIMAVGLAIANPSASGRLGARQFEQACNCNFASNYGKAFGPRLGLSYQVNSKTVIRAGVGLS